MEEHCKQLIEMGLIEGYDDAYKTLQDPVLADRVWERVQQKYDEVGLVRAQLPNEQGRLTSVVISGKDWVESGGDSVTMISVCLAALNG